MTESYFRRTGDMAFAPTSHCEGAWSAQDYHFSSLAGLIVHVAQRSREPGDTKRLVRVSYDILGRLPLEEASVEAKTIRPGRKIELVEVTVHLAGRAAIIARIWYLDALDTSDVETATQQTYPAPEECKDQGFSGMWEGGFIRQLVGRKVTGLPEGTFFSWFTSETTMVDTDERIALAEYFSRIDIANGIAVHHSPTEWAFPNVDLTVHLYRYPSGRWNGLESTNVWGPDGAGLTSTILHDIDGPLGRAEQLQALGRL
ncbi:thioesterase family protein [Corynebacterium liangguodongii]|uniref:Thioesterase n=1 Tax=Corynebacterium liangguodongii TaxID=2079535 RepID=A0A2S0WCG5_9CORY|nr:thioesterase family protein [Corynebacterium liangguodongii]AWB83461.1 thioesterase [Corynebacterium liangguodongii]PWC00450.1 thioesterase family protein [Corynebacterium liangguodongii]